MCNLVLTISHCHEAFKDVLALRAKSYRQELFGKADRFDPHSTIHVAICNGQVVGSLRVTDASRGEMCCQEFMPDCLLSTFSDVIGSASRFCIDQEAQCKGTADRLIRSAWLSALERGKYIDIIDVREEVVRYYRRLGYRLIRGVPFIHPLLGTRSRLMICAAHQTTVGSLSDVFSTVRSGVPMTAVLPWLDSANQCHAQT